MFKTKPQAAAMLATVSAVIIVGLLMVFGGKGQAEQNNPQGRAMTNQSPSEPTAKELDDLATPIVDLNDSSPINGDRILKNARYDKRPLVRTQIDPGVVEVRVYDSVSISDIP